MYQSSRLNDAKRLFQGIKSVSFFHISAVHVRTGVCAYIDGTHLLLLFKRYKVSIVEIHLDSVDNLPGKKAMLWKNELRHHSKMTKDSGAANSDEV